MNRFKGLDLVDRVPEELWTEVRNTVQEAVTKTSQRKRNARRQNGPKLGKDYNKAIYCHLAYPTFMQST